MQAQIERCIVNRNLKISLDKNVELERDVRENVKVSLDSFMNRLSRLGYLKKGSVISAVYSDGLTCF